MVRTYFLAGLLVASAAFLSGCGTTTHSGAGVSTSQNDMAAAGETALPAIESLESLESAYKRNSRDESIAARYARALRDANRLTRANLVLAPFVENQKSKNLDVKVEYASILAAMGNYTESEKYARQAVLMAPESGQAYHVLGVALDAQGHHKQAETAFRKALDHWQGDPVPVMNNLGLNLAAQGFIDEAVSTLRKAAALDPSRTEIERNLRIVSALQVQASPAAGDVAPDKKEGADANNKGNEVTKAPVPEQKPEITP